MANKELPNYLYLFIWCVTITGQWGDPNRMADFQTTSQTHQQHLTVPKLFNERERERKTETETERESFQVIKSRVIWRGGSLRTEQWILYTYLCTCVLWMFKPITSTKGIFTGIKYPYRLLRFAWVRVSIDTFTNVCKIINIWVTILLFHIWSTLNWTLTPHHQWNDWPVALKQLKSHKITANAVTSFLC